MNRVLAFAIAVILCVGVSFHSDAQQTSAGVNIADINHAIASLNRRVNRLIKREKSLAKIKGLRQFHVLWDGVLDLDECSAEELADGSFLTNNHFYNDYYYVRPRFKLAPRRPYTKTHTFITDFSGNLLAYADARAIWTWSHELFNQDLSRLFFEEDIVLAFYCSGVATGRFVALKDNGDLIAVEQTVKGLIVKSWEEFLQSYLAKRNSKDK